MRCACSGVAALRGDEPVERRLRVEHQRRERAAGRRGRRRRPSGRGRSRSACRRASRARARRRAACAGSIVTTHALRPRRAPSSASTAAVVVLPTPPLPQQMTTRPVVDELVDRVHRHSALDPARRTRRRARRAAARPMSGVNRNGSSICGSGSRSREPVDLLVLERVPLGAERGGVREVVGLAVGDEAAARLGVGEDVVDRRRRRRPGSGAKHPLTTTGPSATPARSSIANAVSIDLAHRRLLGQRHEHAPGSAPGRRAASTTSAACLRIGPTRTASSSPRAESRNVIAWPAAGASTMIRSAARASLERLHLAEHEDVLHARAPRSRPPRARPTRPAASRCASARGSRGSRRARRRA